MVAPVRGESGSDTIAVTLASGEIREFPVTVEKENGEEGTEETSRPGGGTCDGEEENTLEEWLDYLVDADGFDATYRATLSYFLKRAIRCGTFGLSRGDEQTVEEFLLREETAGRVKQGNVQIRQILGALVRNESALTIKYAWELCPLVGKCDRLARLCLESGRMRTLPRELDNLKRLRLLSLRHVPLMVLPEGHRNAERVHFLSLPNPPPAPGALPGNRGGMNSLLVLQINHTLLTTLSDAVGELRTLQILHLEKNELRTLPATLGQLPALRFLHVGWNQLTELPQEIATDTLIELHVNNNLLSALPERIENMHALRSLLLDNNCFEALPSEIGVMAGVEVLSADGNGLKRLPWLGGMTKLRMLSLCRNQLEEFPSGTKRTDRLRYLDISDNPRIVVTRETELPGHHPHIVIGRGKQRLTLEIDVRDIEHKPSEVLSRLLTFHLESTQSFPLIEYVDPSGARKQAEARDLIKRLLVALFPKQDDTPVMPRCVRGDVVTWQRLISVGTIFGAVLICRSAIVTGSHFDPALFFMIGASGRETMTELPDHMYDPIFDKLNGKLLALCVRAVTQREGNDRDGQPMITRSLSEEHMRATLAILKGMASYIEHDRWDEYVVRLHRARCLQQWIEGAENSA
ncbi:MAG: hypothetical protein OXF02_01520 [Simkaniaceae bacterium]|nr:hypothetical protein [Simkaniaceae bacterium]